jgi:hypothetical protein
MQEILRHAKARCYVGNGPIPSVLEQPNRLTLERFGVLLPLRFHDRSPRILFSPGVPEIREGSDLAEYGLDKRREPDTPPRPSNQPFFARTLVRSRERKREVYETSGV